MSGVLYGLTLLVLDGCRNLVLKAGHGITSDVGGERATLVQLW